MIEVGQTVGNYRVTAKLGEGGMGAVYLAEHPVIGRRAALKVIHPQHARNADVVTRFVNEATAISRIGHEHIVEVTDFGRTPAGDFYFIMEYLEGRRLSELIEAEAPFAPARAVAVAAQIADALSASHAHGVIHRDLKPENVFLVARGDDQSFVKVLDFGLAKLNYDDPAARASNRTLAGTVMGTPYYMAPEQCEGRSELDQRADVYALGVVLFEMLTGKLPFGGNDYAEVFMKQISVRAPAARSLVPELPDTLELVLQRALAKDPAARFQTMAAFRESLLASEIPGAEPPPARLDEDHSARLRAARPMSRAEVPVREGPLPEAPAPFAARSRPAADDTAFDRPPRQYRAVRIAILAGAATLSGMAVAARVSKPPTPAAAAVTAAPPSRGVAAPPAPEGMLPTLAASGATASSTPSREDDDPPPPPHAAADRHRRRPRAVRRLQDDIDADGVLVPSFLK